MRRSTLLVFLAVPTLATCRSAPEAAPTKPTPAQVNPVAAALAQGLTLNADDPATCAPCHTAVVAEWKDSLHSRAHHASDPLYAALRTLRTQKQGPHIPGACATCHNARDLTDHESPAAKTGVSCALCHQLDAVHLAEGKKGVQTFTPSTALRFRGARDVAPGASPLHETGLANPALQDGTTLCLACHGEEQNPAGVATCTTGPEYAAGKDSRSCVSCHMPDVATASGPVSTRSTHRSHGFVGPHQVQRLGDRSLLADAVKVTGRFESGALVATLENRSAHAFPTGFPARMALLQLTALDAAGAPLGQNVSADPMKEHPDAVFNRGFVDAEGKPSLAPFAAKQVRDNRLKPAETREVRWTVPAQTASVELRLKFFLLAPFAAKQLDYTGPETKPLVLEPVVVKR